jgi:aminocarboxymuconate-semialdehyde decarboxylase
VFTPHQLAELVRLYGPDHIVMGTDYPFDMAEYDPIAHVASVDGLDGARVAAIAGGNARKLLGI